MTDRKHIDPTIYMSVSRKKTAFTTFLKNWTYLLSALTTTLWTPLMNARMLTSSWVSRFARTCFSVIHRRQSSTFWWCRGTRNSSHGISANRSIHPDYPLLRRNIWKPILIWPRALQVFSDWWMITSTMFSLSWIRKLLISHWSDATHASTPPAWHCPPTTFWTSFCRIQTTTFFMSISKYIVYAHCIIPIRTSKDCRYDEPSTSSYGQSFL